jgi:glycerol-3-phosphate dehydrogenase
MTLSIPGRIAFLVPWPRHWVVGTTDKPYHGPVDRPAASTAEVDEILGTLNGALDLSITRADVVGTFAGLRPLVAPADANSTVKISREHRVSVEGPGLVRVSGGKYTTYRVMAADAVDAVLGDEAKRRPTGTAELPIIGAAPRPDLDALAASLAAEPGIGADAATSLVDRYGTEARDVLALGREHDLLRPLVAGHPYLEAEIAWAADRELALSLDDVLARRIRLAQVLPDRGASIAPRAAAIAGHALGWDEARRAGEAARYLEGARKEFDVP